MPLLWILLLLFSPLLPGAAAHFPGDDPLQIDGTLSLRARAGAGIPFELLGPVEGGDILRFEWSVNDGAGPAISFGIQGGSARGGGVQNIYQSHASSDRGEIWLPGHSSYRASWFNFNDEPVRLAFAVEVLPGLLSPGTLLTLLVIGAVGPLTYVLWRVGRKFWDRQKKIDAYLDSLRKR